MSRGGVFLRSQAALTEGNVSQEGPACPPPWLIPSGNALTEHPGHRPSPPALKAVPGDDESHPAHQECALGEQAARLRSRREGTGR